MKGYKARKMRALAWLFAAATLVTPAIAWASAVPNHVRDVQVHEAGLSGRVGCQGNLTDSIWRDGGDAVRRCPLPRRAADQPYPFSQGASRESGSSWQPGVACW